MFGTQRKKLKSYKPAWVGPSAPTMPARSDGKQNGQVLQGDVVHQLVVGALEEGGINGDDGLHAFASQTAGKGHGVLLGDADIEIAVGELLFEFDQSAALAHGGVIAANRESAAAWSHSHLPNTCV